MGKIIQWFKDNQEQITWWIIGWMSFATIDSLARGNYVVAVVDGGLAYMNYLLWKRNQ